MASFKLIPEWHLVHRLWSIRITLFWSGFCGLYAALSAFADLLNPVVFALLSMFMGMAVAAARVTKQPGLRDGE